ncbi:MAG: hypothetical protein HWE26_19830 [Alteromonadaceae bacterium]|nr:hypothetical protein [Alteromonadaceae bacterium]
MNIDWKTIVLRGAALVALCCIQSCAVNNDSASYADIDELPQSVEFGSYCSLPHCPDCSIGGCPLSGATMVGESCTCNTFDGPRNGVVVGQ